MHYGKAWCKLFVLLFFQGKQEPETGISESESKSDGSSKEEDSSNRGNIILMFLLFCFISA